MQLKALLLDLDGTLIDTAPDMVGTLNRLLESEGIAPVEAQVAARQVSNGARALIRHGFGENLTEQRELQLIENFLSDYAEHVCEDSVIYDGMSEVLTLCQDNDIKWGVITNKPLQLSRDLLEGLNLLNRCSILLGGDSLPVKKPDPAPMLHTCMVLNLAPSECLYVGDHARDVEAGGNAGMDTAAALWGYLQHDDDASRWGADYLLKQPASLAQLLHERFR